MHALVPPGNVQGSPGGGGLDADARPPGPPPPFPAHDYERGTFASLDGLACLGYPLLEWDRCTFFFLFFFSGGDKRVVLRCYFKLKAHD